MDNQRQSGFTLVELLIVIVIIAVLAAITVVAYNGIAARGKFSGMQQDLATIVRALELYKVDSGGYPDSSVCVATSGKTNYRFNWCGWDQGSNDSFIPGLAPKYISKTPTLDDALPGEDTYLYRSSNATSGAETAGPNKYYELIRYNSVTNLTSLEQSVDNKLRWTGDGYDTVAWGYKSDPSLPNW